MLLSFLLIILGFALLAFGANRLIDGAASIALHYHLSPLLIGLTILAIGTSLPELLVSLFAAFHGNVNLAVGSVVGSNIANIGLVIAFTALLFPFVLHPKALKRDFVAMFIAMVVLLMMLLTGEVGRFYGLILLLMAVGFLFWVLKTSPKEVPEVPSEKKLSRAWLNLLIGLVLVLWGSDLTVTHAVNLAKYFGVSDLVIGLTLVAWGTSLPELATTLVGARKKQYDLVVGNILGSNIFNIVLVLGVTAIVHPIPVLRAVLVRDVPLMFLIAIVFWSLLYFRKPKGLLSRSSAALLLGLYVLVFLLISF